MLRGTHKAFAEKIALELGFSGLNARIFIDGSLGPDSHGDFPHDHGKNAKLLRKLDAARDLYHLKDEYAYGELGNVLHYIQDKWVGNSADSNQTEIILDEQLSDLINQSKISRESAEEYASMLDILFTSKNDGVDSWFDHEWGIWHRDYSSCIFVFADIVELMLPTLQTDSSIIGNRQKLKEYVQSDAFKKATKDGFFASIITNYLDPKLQGYPAAMYCLSSISPPSNNRNAKVDFNIAYRLSLEIARYTVSKPEVFKFQDSWTHRTETNKHMSLSLVIPQYHVLIAKPVNEVHEERRLSYFDQSRRFLDNWTDTEKSLSGSSQHSETWKILMSGLVDMLKTEKNQQ